MTDRERAVSASENSAPGVDSAPDMRGDVPEGNDGVPGAEPPNTEALLATVREALDGGVPLLYAEDRRARRAAADAALDAIASELERRWRSNEWRKRIAAEAELERVRAERDGALASELERLRELEERLANYGLEDVALRQAAEAELERVRAERDEARQVAQDAIDNWIRPALEALERAALAEIEESS